MMKRIFIVACTSFFFTGILQAQSTGEERIRIENEGINLPYDQTMDSVFKRLDRSKIPSGLLKERTVTLLPWEKLDGGDSALRINLDTLLELYSELYFAHIDMQKGGWKDVSALDSLLSRQVLAHSSIPIMILDMDYQHISQEALNKKWIIADGLQAKDVSPNGQTPFETKTIFAAAPYINRLSSHTATFELDPTCIFSNRLKNRDSVEIDFGDGLGFRWMSAGKSQTITFPIDRPSVVVTVKYTRNGIVFVSSSTLELPVSLTTLSATAVPPPDDSVKLIVYGVEHWYGIWKGCNNTNLHKPVVIVEGYDPTNKRYLYINNPDPKQPDKNLYAVANEQNMADKLRAAGFDIVILNYADGQASLDDKMLAVRNLIQELNRQLYKSKSELVIIAPSEAGLVVRYALASMETSRENHRTRLFISLDAPQQGANMPLAMQYFIQLLFDKVPPLRWFSATSQIMDVLHATPTKQMLRYHYSHFPSPSPEFTNFYRNFNALNGGFGYPLLLKCRRVAISNGSGKGYTQGFNPGDKLFSFNITTGLYNIYADGWALPNQTSEKVFSATVIKPILGFPPVSVRKIYVDGTQPIDGAPGGRGRFIKDIEDVLQKYLGVFHASSIPNEFQSFVPSISALDIRNTDDLFYDIHANLTDYSNEGFNVYPMIMPFDAIFVGSDNGPHVINGITPDIAQFILDEIMPEHLYIQKKQVGGGDVHLEGTKTATIGRNVTKRYPDVEFLELKDVTVRAGESISVQQGTTLYSGTVLSVASFESCAMMCRLESSDKKDQINVRKTTSTWLKSVESSVKSKNAILENFPNPFQDHTHIEFQFEQGKSIDLAIYDLYGHLIQTVSENCKSNGEKQIITFDSTDWIPGFYVAVLKVDGFIRGAIKMHLVR